MKNNEFLLLYKKYTPPRRAIKNTIQSANANSGNIHCETNIASARTANATSASLNTNAEMAT